MVEQTTKGELLIHGKRHKGRIFTVNGEDLELYRVGALADALKKSPQTIAIWEKEGLIPKSMFRITGKGLGHCRRWYSREQIINIYQVWKLFPLTTGAGHHAKPFFEGIRKVFHQTRVVTVTKKEIADERPKGSDSGRSTASGG